MNSSPDAPWKDGSEQSERWKETLGKGFLPRVSDGTGSPGGRGAIPAPIENHKNGAYVLLRHLEFAGNRNIIKKILAGLKDDERL
jgi:hypothetical protein